MMADAMRRPKLVCFVVRLRLLEDSRKKRLAKLVGLPG